MRNLKDQTIPTCESCLSRSDSAFNVLTRDEQERFTEEKGCNFYKRGQVLFTEGSQPSGLYCINEGKIKLFKPGPSGRDQILKLCGKGEIIGYGTLLSGESHNSTAEALEEATVCFIPKNIFLETIRLNVNLHKNIKSLLCKDVRDTENNLIKLSQKQVRERVAETLLIIKEKFGYKEDGMTLDINLTREEIANVVGTATESVIRLLSEFQKNGMIKLNNRSVQIINCQKLFREANLSA